MRHGTIRRQSARRVFQRPERILDLAQRKLATRQRPPGNAICRRLLGHQAVVPDRRIEIAEFRIVAGPLKVLLARLQLDPVEPFQRIFRIATATNGCIERGRKLDRL